MLEVVEESMKCMAYCCAARGNKEDLMVGKLATVKYYNTSNGWWSLPLAHFRVKAGETRDQEVTCRCGKTAGCEEAIKLGDFNWNGRLRGEVGFWRKGVMDRPTALKLIIAGPKQF